MGLKSFSSCCRQDSRPNLDSEVFSEHEMIVEGITLKERKEQSASLNDEEKKKLVLTHTRWIGNQSLIVHTVIADDEEKKKVIETDLTEKEVEDFMKKWQDLWHPRIV